MGLGSRDLVAWLFAPGRMGSEALGARGWGMGSEAWGMGWTMRARAADVLGAGGWGLGHDHRNTARHVTTL